MVAVTIAFALVAAGSVAMVRLTTATVDDPGRSAMWQVVGDEVDFDIVDVTLTSAPATTRQLSLDQAAARSGSGSASAVAAPAVAAPAVAAPAIAVYGRGVGAVGITPAAQPTPGALHASAAAPSIRFAAATIPGTVRMASSVRTIRAPRPGDSLVSALEYMRSQGADPRLDLSTGSPRLVDKRGLLPPIPLTRDGTVAGPDDSTASPPTTPPSATQPPTKVTPNPPRTTATPAPQTPGPSTSQPAQQQPWGARQWARPTDVAVANRLRAHPAVRYVSVYAPGRALVSVARGVRVAELPGIAQAHPSVTAQPQASTPPAADDPSWTRWWLQGPTQAAAGSADTPRVDVGASRAWARTKGAGVVIAILDDGVDLSHPELAGRIWTDPDEPCGSKVDADGDGLVGDCHGWNWIKASPDVANLQASGLSAASHGTAVASVAAGNAGNGLGASGIAPQAKIMPMVIGPGHGQPFQVAVVPSAIRYAVDHGASVITCPFGGAWAVSPQVRDAIRYAAARNVLVTFPAGNDAADRDTGEAWATVALHDEPNVLVVGASDERGEVATFSAYGRRSVHLFAPGAAVTVAATAGVSAQRGGFLTLDGTSLAASLVSGAAALIRGAEPAITAAELKELILSTAARAPAYAESVSGGRLDIAAAISRLPPASS